MAPFVEISVPFKVDEKGRVEDVALDDVTIHHGIRDVQLEDGSVVAEEVTTDLYKVTSMKIYEDGTAIVDHGFKGGSKIRRTRFVPPGAQLSWGEPYKSAEVKIVE